MRPLIKQMKCGDSTWFEAWVETFCGSGASEDAAKADLLCRLNQVIADGKRAEIIRFRLDLSPPSTATGPGDR